MESWVEAGQDPAYFWRLTLRQISTIMAGAAKRIERELMFSEMNAWQTARLTMLAIHKPNKFPPFNKVSSAGKRRKRQKPQSWQEQKSLAQHLNAAFGGEVING